MKPENIFLVRHGESQANINYKILMEIPDYAVRLTELGEQQVRNTAQNIKNIIGEEKAAIYCSPFFRARDTANIIYENINADRKFLFFDPRIREQEWISKLGVEAVRDEEVKARDYFGRFFYKSPGMESCADVYTRIDSFVCSLYRTFEKDCFPKNVILSTHGMAMRIFLMRWFKLSPDEFDILASPDNGEIWHIKLENNKYKLVSKIKKYESSHSPFKYPTNLPFSSQMVL